MATPALVFNALSIVMAAFQYGHHIGELNSPQEVISTCNHVPPGTDPDGSLPLCIPMSSSQWSVLVATLSVGGFLGSLFVGARLADSYGRRKALLLNNVFLLLGSFIMSTASSFGGLLLGRLLIGVGCGVATVVVPMYIAEISPAELRGTLGVMNQLGIVVGILFSQVLGLFFSTPTGWRVILLAGTGLSALQMFLLPLCVESPRYLILQPGGSTEAKHALQILRGRQDVAKEMRDWTRQDDRTVAAEEEGHAEPTDALLSQVHGQDSQPANAVYAFEEKGKRITVMEFVAKPRYRQPLIVLFLVQLSQQLSGINGVVFYSTSIMSRIMPSSGAMITVYISIVNTFMTLFAAYMMDRAGRRALLLASSSAMGVSSFLLATSLNYSIPILSAFSIISFVATFAIGLGPIPFLIIPEVVETAAVASASAFALTVNWTTNFIVSVMFLKLQEWWGGNVFYLFAVILAALTVAIHRIIPETRGKTPEEVARAWHTVQH
ncbi:hypothetical protein BGW38_004062 [Lunasporangiospora selenospora]|uniref:Major facilitator superfamily (MFS) profile domain-containing protein n=1 Tax=Lunasporangiospora selenospora TaxID=979761 RepID=A0A9P6FQL4_9FUNG|nr:hypothetical protein BGW38_004062 [Lunasporangiospora selenospora]